VCTAGGGEGATDAVSANSRGENEAARVRHHGPNGRRQQRLRQDSSFAGAGP